MTKIEHTEGDCHACLVYEAMEESRYCEGCREALTDYEVTA